MNTQRDRLDNAIDAVAARLTRVTDNDALASQIIGALPERRTWLPHWLMPRLAISAALVIAALGITVVLRTFDDRSTAVLRSAVLSSPAVELAAAALEHRTTREPASIIRGTFVEPSQNERRTTDVPDHERALLPIDAVAALVVPSMSPVEIPPTELLTIAPIVVSDLPMTAESFSQQR